MVTTAVDTTVVKIQKLFPLEARGKGSCDWCFRLFPAKKHVEVKNFQKYSWFYVRFVPLKRTRLNQQKKILPVRNTMCQKQTRYRCTELQKISRQKNRFTNSWWYSFTFFLLFLLYKCLILDLLKPSYEV